MKFSIIMATYNAEKHLERALASIATQSYPNYEVVVQDGGSKDRTLKILEEFSPIVKLQSEPDKGIYDAWNKAVARASGDWAIFLGADDCLANTNVLVRARHHLRQLPQEVVMAYGALLLGENGQVSNVDNRPLSVVYHRFTQGMGIPWTAAFIRVPVLRANPFNPKFKIAGDYDLAARIVTSSNLARLPLIVSYMEKGGVSDRKENLCLRNDEFVSVVFNHILPKAQDLVFGNINNYFELDMSLETV